MGFVDVGKKVFSFGIMTETAVACIPAGYVLHHIGVIHAAE